MSEKGEPGRPKHRVTAETRRRVEVLAGSGIMTQEEIAICLRISKPTLRLYYPEELTAGAYARRAEVIEAAFKKAVESGNTAAVKAYLAGTPEVAAPVPADEPEGQPPILGKKEAAQVAATVAAEGTDWASLLPAHSAKPH